MERVGLLGKKGSGKDTLADYLVNSKGFVKYSFAKPIKDIAKILFNLSETQLYGDRKEQVDERWGISPRVIFQRLGTEFGQGQIYDLFPELKIKIKDKELWLKLFDIFLEENKDKKHIVIADVSFKHEIDHLKKLNFNIIKINRKDSVFDNHISEKQDDLFYDYLIDNNASKQDLFNKYDDFIYIPF